MVRITMGARRCALCALLGIASIAIAQPPAVPNLAGPVIPPPPPPPDSGGLTIRDSSVGYIDSASPADQVRLRTDLGWDFQFPNRSELFYAQGQPRGPGLPLPERRVDFQEYSLYVEKLLAADISVFFEGGMRGLNPVINRNALGVADANLGFKYAFWTTDAGILTAQLRAYLPSGAASQGLGTHHVSLEPALLGFTQLTDDLGLAAELRYWQPIDGSNFAGSVIRYGLGLRYNLWCWGDCRLAPIVEAIGWYCLNGNESRLIAPGVVSVRDATGISVVNLKVGVRLDLGERAGLYVGYGRAVTGDRWYSDIVRAEFRWLY